MKQYLPIIISVMFSVIGVVLFTNVLLFANEQSSANVTITATIRPTRIIVVDNSLTIQKIVSNTSEDVRPIVVEGSIDGREIEFSDSVSAQYRQLKPSLNFSKPGVLYERDSRPIQNLIKRVVGRFGKITQSPV